MIEDGLKDLIIKDIIDGYNRAGVEVKYCPGGISKAKIKKVYKEALIELDEANKDIATNLRNIQLERYLSLYQSAKEIGDIRTANSTLNSIDKLFGLQSQKIDMNVKDYTITFD